MSENVFPSDQNELLYATGSIAPSTTSTILTHVLTSDAVVHSVQFGGTGDGKVIIKFDGAPVGFGFIFRGQPTAEFILNTTQAAGVTVSVDITCEATATADFHTTLAYRYPNG
ncbi:hypothetical protein [Zhongshania sp.]|uniref:hypothetical protein n=1 Tax=Zhongshania sp. TaxID=1971902 RepID=UPI0035686954